MSVEALITEHLDTWTGSIQRRNAVGRGSSKKIELYGVKKLRELILELAVRGRLVPQDADDEPTEVLLARIAAEMKPKVSTPIADNDKPFELPNGWSFCRLQDVIRIASGTGLTSKNMNKDGKIPVFGGNGITGFHDNHNVDKATLVIGRVGFYCGSVHITPDKAWVTDNAFITTFSEKNIDLYFLALLLKASNLNQNDSATAQPVISGKKVYPIIVALPPLEEQPRIVAKVNELMQLCDQLEQATENNLSAHETLVSCLLDTLTQSQNADDLAKNWQILSQHFDTLFTTEASIDQLKQTILQLAVMGKLVQQDPNDEPAEVLLAQIAAEKARLVKEKKIKKQKVLPEITEEEKPFDLPDGWAWCRFSDVVISRLGKMLDKSKNTGELRKYLRNTNVQWRHIDLSDLKEMRFEKSEFEEFSLKKGDFLICEGGEPARCAIWSDDRTDVLFQKALHRARACHGVLPEYLELCFIVDTKNGRLAKLFTGATIKHLPADKLARYIFALPPVEEQERIISESHAFLKLCDQLKTNLTQAQKTQLQLTDTLVDQAL